MSGEDYKIDEYQPMGNFAVHFRERTPNSDMDKRDRSWYFGSILGPCVAIMIVFELGWALLVAFWGHFPFPTLAGPSGDVIENHLPVWLTKTVPGLYVLWGTPLIIGILVITSILINWGMTEIGTVWTLPDDIITMPTYRSRLRQATKEQQEEHRSSRMRAAARTNAERELKEGRERAAAASKAAWHKKANSSPLYPVDIMNPVAGYARLTPIGESQGSPFGRINIGIYTPESEGRMIASVVIQRKDMPLTKDQDFIVLFYGYSIQADPERDRPSPMALYNMTMWETYELMSFNTREAPYSTEYMAKKRKALDNAYKVVAPIVYEEFFGTSTSANSSPYA